MAGSAVPARARTRGAEKARRGGFTLIELLVVVAVIAILAALIMPAMSSAIESGQRVRCQSSLRQVGQALASYIKDTFGILPWHDDHEPNVLPPPNGSGLYRRQALGRLLFFLSDPLVLRCTADAGPFTEPGKGRYFSYTCNTSGHRKNRNISEVERSHSQCISFLDGSEKDGGTDGNNDRPYLPGGLSTSYGFRRHSEGFNALFLDGHIQWYPIGETSDEDYNW